VQSVERSSVQSVLHLDNGRRRLRPHLAHQPPPPLLLPPRWCCAATAGDPPPPLLPPAEGSMPCTRDGSSRDSRKAVHREGFKFIERSPSCVSRIPVTLGQPAGHELVFVQTKHRHTVSRHP